MSSPSGHIGSISAFWSDLRGPVHTKDEPVFRRNANHTFDLRFPPPAFIGDIENSPIIVLMSNGAYKPGITENEFRNERDISEYLAYIRGETKRLPSSLASYYSTGRVGEWIYTGQAVLVNAIAYRSPQLSGEPQNKKIAEALPSLQVHRHWLLNEVLPAAADGKRFVFVHRNSWWKVPKSAESANVIFSDSRRAEPNRQAPDSYKLELAQKWLKSR